MASHLARAAMLGVSYDGLREREVAPSLSEVSRQPRSSAKMNRMFGFCGKAEAEAAVPMSSECAPKFGEREGVPVAAGPACAIANPLSVTMACFMPS